MRILFLGLAVPDFDEYHNLYSELMIEFKNRGHDLLIVAPARDDSRTGLRMEFGIKVLRVPTLKLFRVGKLEKGLATFLLPYQYKAALKRSNIDLKFDLVMMPTPPITLAKVVGWIKKKYRAKVYLILRDIFPQNAVDLKMMNVRSPSYWYFRNMEKKMYHICDHIGCMSQGNIDFVKKHNPWVASKKLHLLPNWGPLRELQSDAKTSALKEKYGVVNKFVIIFGGNIGKPQKVENIVNLAIACRDNPEFYFLMFGGGTEKAILEQMILDNNLNNIKFYEYLSRDAFFEVLQIADIGLVSLSQDFTIPNIPSKSLAYFNAKKPILASIDNNTDFGTMLEQINAGVWAEAGNTDALKEKLLLLYNDADLRKLMGENGYAYMVKHMQTYQAYETILSEINVAK